MQRIRRGAQRRRGRDVFCWGLEEIFEIELAPAEEAVAGGRPCLHFQTAAACQRDHAEAPVPGVDPCGDLA